MASHIMPPLRLAYSPRQNSWNVAANYDKWVSLTHFFEFRGTTVFRHGYAANIYEQMSYEFQIARR